MNLVRRVIGFGGRGRGNNEEVVSQTNQDDALCLMHLRKLFMELLHSPEPLTIKEQEVKLYQMLPLFCKVFCHAKPSTITERFGDACQFAAHVSRLMANEIKRRAANRSKEAASKAIMEFLREDSVEQTTSGWNLLNTLNILAAGERPVVECMVAASLPSNMVKCLYLFYELPQEHAKGNKTSEELKEEISIVQKLYCQVLVKLCNHAATARELVHTDELSLLFTAMSCSCPLRNIEWRSCVSEILMTLTRHGLEKEVIGYIHGKSCIAQCILNMRRVQTVNPLELIEMIVALVCCLKDSADKSHLLLADFRSCHGYLFLTDLLLMLGEMTEEEAREACRNVIHLVSSLVMIGHVPLRPLTSLGNPFQDPNFLVPQPLGKDLTIRNVEAFQVLQTVFLKTKDTLVCKIILECIHNIYSHDGANYFILEPQHTLSLFIEKAPEKAIEVQEKLFELLELVITQLNWVPCQELMSVSIMFKNKKVADCHLVALSFMFKVLTCEPKYKDIFRDVGILEVLTHCLKHYANVLKEKQNGKDGVSSPSYETKDYSYRNSLVPDLESPQLKDYPLLLMGCLRLLLEGNPKNATVFRECGGARCAHNMVPNPGSRADALRIIHELILSGGSDDLSTLLGLMHTASQSEVRLKIDVLHALLRVFDLDPNTREVFREVGGFVYVMSLLIGMEGCLAVPCSSVWQDSCREDILALLRKVFHVLTAAMQDEPTNKSFFMDEVRFRGLSDTIRLLGCFNLTVTEIPQCCGNEILVQRLKIKKQSSVASQHPVLAAQASDASVASSTIAEVNDDNLDLEPTSVLYAANEMFKNLFDMSTDSFSVRSATYSPPDLVSSGFFHPNIHVPHVYHPGALTAMVDLFPAVCNKSTCPETTEVTILEDCLELLLHWISKIQQMLKSEHNQQVMCEAGLPHQLLLRCEAAFSNEDHPLHKGLQRIFERLSSQALTPTVLRDFLRLGSPLFSKALDTLEDKPENDETDDTDIENEPKHTDITDNNPRVRKLSEETTKRLTDASRRVSAHQRPRTAESRQSTLSYKDVNLSLSIVQGGLESSSGEDSDFDEGSGFEFVRSDNKTTQQSVVQEASAVEKDTLDQSDMEEETPVRPARKRDRKRRQNAENNCDMGFSGHPKALFCSSDNSSPTCSPVPGTVVDGVDIDTFGEQGVTSIDQGDDMVILDMNSEATPVSNHDKSCVDDLSDSPSRSDDSTLDNVVSSVPIKHSENTSFSNDCGFFVNEQPANSLDTSISKESDSNEIVNSESNSETGSSEDVQPNRSKRLTSVSELNITKCIELMDDNRLVDSEIEHNGSQTSGDFIESFEDEEVPRGHGGGPVPLTRVKCLVSMTTPRDARSHGSTDTPPFVEFDMSIDGFGCLFLPAIAPQAAPGIAAVGAVVATPTVMSAVPGIGTGERIFPPQAGLTFSSWICIDRYSSPNDDPHPVRLLTIARQFRSLDSTVHNVPCLTISISARDKMLMVCTEEGANEEGQNHQARREKDHTEARFLSDSLLEEGRWHHVVVVLNRAMIRNSTVTLFVDGNYVSTAKLRYIQASPAVPNASTTIVAPYIMAYIGTAPTNRRCSRLLWKLGPTHLMEEPLSAQSAGAMFYLGPNYVGSFQAPYFDDEQVTSKEREALDPLIIEDKLMFGIYAHAQSVVTIQKMRKHYMKIDTKAIAKELGLSIKDNATPVHMIHNTAAHLQGPSRTIGAIIIGCSGVRTFCPSPVARLIECTGGVSGLLGMVAMATDVEGLYASVKALSCVLRSNMSARRDMVRVRGYQILALLLKRKKHMLNTHILHLTFALVGTEDSNRESSVIPNKIAFRDLLCDLEVWRDAPADLQKSLYYHFLELLGPGSEMHRNAELMQRVGLVPKLLFVLLDDPVSEATTEKIASVLSALLSNPNETANLLRFGQFLASTLPAHPINENELLSGPATFIDVEEGNGEPLSEEAILLKKINLRNVMLYMLQCLLFGDDGQVDQSFADALQETLGFDWLLLFVQAHLRKSTVVRAVRILVTMLSSQPALARFKEGHGNGGWLCGTEMMVNKPTLKAAGFKVSTISEGQTNYEVNREICNIPGFLLLNSLLPKHIEVAEIYHLVIALLLGHPVCDVYDGAQFDWDNLFSVFWASKPGGPRVTPPSPEDPGCYSIYCPEASLVLLKMTHVMVNESLEGIPEGSWLIRYPETVVEFLTYLYRNVGEFGSVCTSQDFLENLVGILFPKRRGSSAPPQDSDNEGGIADPATRTRASERTYLITHQVKKKILEFLRVIMTDCLTCTSSNKGLPVIDYILESYPSRCRRAAQAEYQTEVLCAQMEFFLGGNLLTNPSAGTGDHAKVVANAFYFASKMVDKLWIGNFSQGYKVVFEFIMNMIKAVKGQRLPMDKIYHSLNRTVLYELSRPLARLTDQSRLLEFLHTLAMKHDIIFVSSSHAQDFIAGVCHWLLVMGTLADRVERAASDGDIDSLAVNPNRNHEVGELFESGSEDDTGTSEMLRLLASSAERVWKVLIEEKRELIDDAFKPIDLPRPTFTSFTSSKDVMDYMSSSSAGANLNLDLKSVRPLIGDRATRVWMEYITAEEKRKAEALSHQKPSKRLTVRSLGSTKKSKKEKQDFKGLVRDSYRWTLNHVTVVRDLVKLHYKNHIQNYNLISKSVAEDWTLMEADLTRERGLWGPPQGSRLDKWALDVVEGPHRMRKKMCRNDMFYVHYPFDPQLHQHRSKFSKYKVPVSLDSKHFYMLRGKISPGVGPIESLTQQQGSTEVGKKYVNQMSVTSDSSFVKEANEGSGVDNQTILKLLEAGEEITSMYRCARIQGLDTAEGLFLFGQDHFYVVDGVTMLSTKEIKDIDSLPPGTHDPIIPKSSHDKARSGTIERMCSRWAKEDIREVHKRRYLLQETALEVFLSDGHNHFLVFPKSVRNKVYDKLTPSLLMAPEESVSGMKRDADVEAGVGLINTLMGERNVTQRWERGEITNFQYLMHLNTLAGRSYNDLMQYPVFPWVLADYDSEELDLLNPTTFRDLSKPMGAQSEERLKQFQKRFAEWEDPSGETPPYHYGTHYSSQMTVASYLIRMEPFSQHFIKLQGGHFDLADRLFHSVKDAWLSASKTNMADVKELIPEFFYLPEFLSNDNNFDFGAKQNGEVLGDVILPPWAKGDTREFIRLHRKALECDYVSSHLHEWIDLVFGYKQQGKPAEEASNVFLYLFYEGQVDVHGIEDDVKRNAAIGVINNFGQTPKQLFRRPHPPKKATRTQDTDLQVDKLFFHNLANLVPSAQPVKVLKGPVQEIIQSDRGMLAVENNKLLVPPNYSRYVAWGFGDLSIRTGHYETDKIIAVYENFHLGQVLCAACPDFRTLITGGTSTLVCVWDMVKGSARDRKPQLLLHEVLYGHHAPVTCLTVSTAYNLILSGSEDQTCIIWDLSKLSYIRQLPGHAAPITAIAINDLTGDICTCAGTYLFVWSVNGKLIAKENTSLQTNNHIKCCAMSELSEWDEQNVILTGSLDGVVRFWGIEFYDEAKTRRALRTRKSTVEKDETVSTTDARNDELNTHSFTKDGEKENPEFSPELAPAQKTENVEGLNNVEWKEATETAEDACKEEASALDREKDPKRIPADEQKPPEGDVEGIPRSSSGSTSVHRSGTLDDEYVIIESKAGGDDLDPNSKPVWKRKLVLRNKLTMHTAFDRMDNTAPAAITALKISKDHKKLYVGDGRGRIYSWSVTDAAGRMANHWIKDESAESCSSCNVKFATFERRHHCRDCGKVFCNKCSRFEAPINRLQIYRPVRVCHKCFIRLTKGRQTRKIM